MDTAVLSIPFVESDFGVSGVSADALASFGVGSSALRTGFAGGLVTGAVLAGVRVVSGASVGALAPLGPGVAGSGVGGVVVVPVLRATGLVLGSGAAAGGVLALLGAAAGGVGADIFCIC